MRGGKIRWRAGNAAPAFESIVAKAAPPLAAIALIVASLVAPAAGQPTERRVTFLGINDIYRLEGIAEGQSGGLTRVRTWRRWIERDAPNAILLHAGDFLSPSLNGKVFKGAQMIDALNNLDGDPNAFDARMFVAFGNHEFDDSRCNKADSPLDARIGESQFTWLVANLDFSDCASMNGVPKRQNVKDAVVIEVDTVKVGIFGIGLTPDKESAPKYPRFEEAAPAARRSIAALREKGADVIVALTHLPREDDEALLREFAPAGLDLLVGGHDHSHMVLFDRAGEPRGFKADSDARTAWRIDVLLAPGKRPRVEAQLVTLNEAIPTDDAMAKLARSWSARAEQAICAARPAGGQFKPTPPQTCLDEKIGRSQGMIELEETANRSQETGFGDWLADVVLKETGADVAIINSGILGLNEDLSPGHTLTLRHTVDIFRFDDVMAVRALPASQVCAAIAHGLLRPGTGAWPHLGGVKAVVTRTQIKYQTAAVMGFTRKKGITCKSRALIKVAAAPFLLCGGDDYPLLPASENCIVDLQKKPFPAGTLRKARKLSEMAEAAIRAAGQAGIKPDKDGRVRFIERGAGN